MKYSDEKRKAYLEHLCSGCRLNQTTALGRRISEGELCDECEQKIDALEDRSSRGKEYDAWKSLAYYLVDAAHDLGVVNRELAEKRKSAQGAAARLSISIKHEQRLKEAQKSLNKAIDEWLPKTESI